MRIVVLGATGNVGTSVVQALSAEPAVGSVVGLARRSGAELSLPKVTWGAADITSDDLVPWFKGADAVIHLAWKIQPSRRLEVMRATNVDGSARVLAAVAAARVPALLYASSVGAYSPGPKHPPVDESWPTDGVPSSFYSRHKAAVERLLDGFEADHPSVRVVRMRKALIFKREAAARIRRLFLGPLVPVPLLHPKLLPVVPDTPRLVFQAVHTSDVAEAYRLACLSDARGPFNIAADPVLDPAELGRVLGARPVAVPPAVLRRGASLTWRLHLQPTPPGWLDLAFGSPILDSERARRELGWKPTVSSGDALLELLAGFRARDGVATPASASGTGRLPSADAG